MSKTKNAVVLGNCQAQLMETLFYAGSNDLAFHTMPPTFQLTDEMKAGVEDKLEQADIIFAQRVDQNYPIEWVRPAVLREKYGHKVLIWPNIYFDGYFPDVQYIYLDRWGKLQSPLEDYHFASIVKCYKDGLSVEETSRFFEGQNPAEDTFEASIDRLRAREADVDIPISDFVARTMMSKRLFYTPNHPYSLVLIEMCRRLSSKAEISYDPDLARSSPARLDRIYIPAHPAIRKNRNLPFDHLSLFRGVEVKSVSPGHVELGGSRSFTLREIVSSYFNIYDYAFGAPSP